jgi:hypothetical protein
MSDKINTTLKLTVLKPVVNIRRGTSSGASFIRDAKIGQQFDVIQVIDLKSPEKWAKIILDDDVSVDAYVCVTLPSGKDNCQVSAVPMPPQSDGQFMDGMRKGLDRAIAVLQAERAKLQ